MIRLIAKLIRPLIEETLRQIHGECADQAARRARNWTLSGVLLLTF